MPPRCCAAGLAALGTDDDEVYEDLKSVLYTDSAGEDTTTRNQHACLPAIVPAGRQKRSTLLLSSVAIGARGLYYSLLSYGLGLMYGMYGMYGDGLPCASEPAVWRLAGSAA